MLDGVKAAITFGFANRQQLVGRGFVRSKLPCKSLQPSFQHFTLCLRYSSSQHTSKDRIKPTGRINGSIFENSLGQNSRGFHKGWIIQSQQGMQRRVRAERLHRANLARRVIEEHRRRDDASPERVDAAAI